jgi:hypothetical protein
MNYFLWIDDKQQGPYEAKQVIDMLTNGTITGKTLCCPQGFEEWNPVRTHLCFPTIRATEKERVVGECSPVATMPGPPDEEALPVLYVVEESGVAVALKFVAALELISTPFACVGSGSASLGILIFMGGVTSGLILFGFAKVVEHLYESAQRLRRIEMLLLRVRNAKTTN